MLDAIVDNPLGQCRTNTGKGDEIVEGRSIDVDRCGFHEPG